MTRLKVKPIYKYFAITRSVDVTGGGMSAHKERRIYCTELEVRSTSVLSCFQAMAYAEYMM